MDELYVDPQLASDSGTGVIGDPYGDVEYCLEQEDWNAASGIRVNIRAGADEVLAVELSVAMADVSAPGKTIAWVPTATAPVIFQGYTSVAGDRGLGGIDGNGLVSIINDTAMDNVAFVDMHLHNTGANTIATLDNDASFIRCKLNNTASTAIDVDNNVHVTECYITDVGVDGVIANNGIVEFTRFVNGAVNKFNHAIDFSSAGEATRNTFVLDGASTAIRLASVGGADNNSIFSDAGTGQGIVAAAAAVPRFVTNNTVVGLSGAGGIGFDLDVAGCYVKMYHGNAAYNNETNYADPAYTISPYGDNEVTSISPFTDGANGDFQPVDTGNIKEGSQPQLIGGGLS